MSARTENILEGMTSIPLPQSRAEENDATLVVAARGGNNQAFELLVLRHQKQVLAIALRFTRIHEDAEDIAQQSFQKAFLHLHQFEGHSSFSTWLTRIAINEALMWQRRKRASPELPLERSKMTDEALPLDFPDPGPNPEESCIRYERERILTAAMDELSPAVRKAIELREIEELSTLETARVLDLSVQAVKSRLFHGRRSLRELLKGYVKSNWGRENQVARRSHRVNWMSRDPILGSACD